MPALSLSVPLSPKHVFKNTDEGNYCQIIFSLKFCIETVSGESDHVFLKAVHQLLLSLTAIHKLVRDQIQARPLTAKIFSVGFDFLSLKVSQAGLKVFSTKYFPRVLMF